MLRRVQLMLPDFNFKVNGDIITGQNKGLTIKIWTDQFKKQKWAIVGEPGNIPETLVDKMSQL